MLKFLKNRIARLLSNDKKQRFKITFKKGTLAPYYYIYLDAKNHHDAYLKLSSDERSYACYIENEDGDKKTINEILGKKVLLKLY